VDAFIFSNDSGGFLDSGNFRKRVLHQFAETLNLPKPTFQVIHQTIATLSQTKGPLNATQGKLRHDRLPTRGNVYVQIFKKEVEGMVEFIHDEFRKPSTGAKNTSTIAANLRDEERRRSAHKQKVELAPIGWHQKPSSPGVVSMIN
jgi:hypothetical protein